MFKLVKILNGRINQPEPICLPVQADAANKICLFAGSFLRLDAGKLVNCKATEKPEYLCAKTMTVENGAQADAVVYPLTADMVFECPVSGDANTLVVGESYTLAQTIYDATNELSYASGVATQTEGGVVRVYQPSKDGKTIWVTISA